MLDMLASAPPRGRQDVVSRRHRSGLCSLRVSARGSARGRFAKPPWRFPRRFLLGTMVLIGEIMGTPHGNLCGVGCNLGKD